jgi:CheY-like chemotaxis protein
MTRVLVVDDEPQILRALAINLRARHYDVFTAATGAGALAEAAAHEPDLVVLDLGLNRPGIGGGSSHGRVVLCQHRGSIRMSCVSVLCVWSPRRWPRIPSCR